MWLIFQRKIDCYSSVLRIRSESKQRPTSKILIKIRLIESSKFFVAINSLLESSRKEILVKILPSSAIHFAVTFAWNRGIYGPYVLPKMLQNRIWPEPASNCKINMLSPSSNSINNALRRRDRPHKIRITTPYSLLPKFETIHYCTVTLFFEKRIQLNEIRGCSQRIKYLVLLCKGQN